jgi:hypothetical protein
VVICLLIWCVKRLSAKSIFNGLFEFSSAILYRYLEFLDDIVKDFGYARAKLHVVRLPQVVGIGEKNADLLQVITLA